MTTYLLDTHIWLWLVTDASQLGGPLRRRIERVLDRCYLSPVSIAEATRILDRGRVRVRITPSVWIRESLERIPVRDAPYTREVAFELDRFRGLRDPADALIAATALVGDHTLVTMDVELIALPGLQTLSG